MLGLQDKNKRRIDLKERFARFLGQEKTRAMVTLEGERSTLGLDQLGLGFKPKFRQALFKRRNSKINLTQGYGKITPVREEIQDLMAQSFLSSNKPNKSNANLQETLFLSTNQKPSKAQEREQKDEGEKKNGRPIYSDLRRNQGLGK